MKAKLNYWVDVGIGISFVLSAISGLFFLLPLDVGAALNAAMPGIGYRFWNLVHTWSSLGMIVGVLAHLVLHWKWIVTMTGKMLSKKRSQRAAATPGGPSAQHVITRRRFLTLGLTTVATGAVVVSCAALASVSGSGGEQEGSGGGSLESGSEQPLDGDEVGEDEPSVQQEENVSPMLEPEHPVQETTPSPTDEPAQVLGVACPRGMVNDPFPGSCRQYTDNDGDGICDYSVPGSGTNPVRN